MTTRRTLALAWALAAAAALAGCGSAPEATPAAAMSVSLLAPANGATVSSPFFVRFGVKGMALKPAGELIEGSGHHHLLINQQPIEAGRTVPVTPQHIHLGKAQTEVEVSLAPGTYTLTAQFANGAHQSYGAGMSQTITVTVK